ncbi:MAG: hypothetical protein JXB32_04655 [Deltaproteobacteria bacterium]|nr:hypothetical protein [Deltaproteobacteria bacterium]
MWLDRWSLDSPRLRRTAWLSGLAAVAAVAGFHVLYYFPRAVDDMYIFLRYAANLAHGDGLVYNPGERVEGFSSPVWVLLLALGELLGTGGLGWAKLLALGAVAALFVGIYRFARERLALGAPAALLACAFSALDSYLVSWSLWGLETPLFLALMLWTAVLLGRVADGGATRRTTLAGGAVAGLFALSRPEAPLFLAALGAAALLEPLRLPAVRERLRRLWLPGAVALALFLAWLLFRRTYYGLWWPHTYYAKQLTGFHWSHLAPLWSQGAGGLERIFVWGGLALAALLAVRRRTLVPLLVALAAGWFTATAFLDWMPNVRHLLPLYVVLPFGWAWAAERAAAWRRNDATGWCARAPGRAAAAAAVLVLLGAGLGIARTDARYSLYDFHTHGGEHRWILRKTWAKWIDTWLCLRRIAPPHVRAMDAFDMGMITQLYRLLEADARPLAETWYVGRDIGRVGWLAEARVFDTDGLFTPAVVQDAEWRRRRDPSPELVRRALDRPVVMTELMTPWDLWAREDPELRRRYRPWWPGDWGLLTPREARVPSPEQILERYRRAAARMPQAFYTMTLYGEAVGAALQKRLEFVRQAALDNEQPVVGAAPAGLPGSGVTLESVAQFRGCTVEPETAAPGQELRVTCWFLVLGGTEQRLRVFLHFDHTEGRAYRFQADHEPAAGFSSTDRWRPGETVRDVSRVIVPPDAPAGPFRLFTGLFDGDRRLRGYPASTLDPDGRVPGPGVRVEPK